MNILYSIRTVSIILFLMVCALVFSCIAHAAEANLTWTAPDDERVVGYSIYVGQELPLTEVTHSLDGVGTTSCSLILEDNKWYYITATSRDANDNQSDQSIPLHYKAETASPPVTDPAECIEIETRLPMLQININMVQ